MKALTAAGAIVALSAALLGCADSGHEERHLRMSNEELTRHLAAAREALATAEAAAAAAAAARAMAENARAEAETASAAAIAAREAAEARAEAAAAARAEAESARAEAETASAAAIAAREAAEARAEAAAAARAEAESARAEAETASAAAIAAREAAEARAEAAAAARAEAESARAEAETASAAAIAAREAAEARAEAAEAARAEAESARAEAESASAAAIAAREAAEARADAAREDVAVAERRLLDANSGLIPVIVDYGGEVADSELPAHQQLAMNLTTLRVDFGLELPPGTDPNAPEVQAYLQVNEIADRSNHLLYTDTHVFRSAGERLRIPSLCRFNVCERGYSSSISPRFLGVSLETIERLPDTNGIASLAEKEKSSYMDLVSFAGWMDHAYFSTVARAYVAQVHPTYGDTVARSFVSGSSTYTNPVVEGTATWRGVVLATDPSVTESLESVVTGDVLVSVDLRDGEVLADVRLDNLVNASTGTEYHYIVYEDVAVQDGEFDAYYGENDFLKGAFYGPDHEEVAGIFEHWQELVGAYGARRESE